MTDNDKLIMKMLPYGKRWAQRRAYYMGDPEEMESIAQLAIVEACRSYNPDCGASLKTCCYRAVGIALRNERLRRQTVQLIGDGRQIEGKQEEPLRHKFPAHLQSVAEKLLTGRFNLREIERDTGIPRALVSQYRREIADILNKERVCG